MIIEQNAIKKQGSPLGAAREAEALLHVHQRAKALVDGGFGHMMLPIIPFGARVSGQAKPAIGKVPGEWIGTSWRNAWNWPKMPPLSVGAWKTLPANTGIGLRTGELVGFDIDVKVDPTSTDPHDVKARELADMLRRELARFFGLPANELARRERAGSTSSVIFARAAGELFKKLMTFEAAGRRHALEFLATGQQVVVSGLHNSGSLQKSNLVSRRLADLPVVTAADVTTLRDDAIAFGADVLIVDTIADLYAGSELDRAQVNDFVKRFLGGLGVAIGGSVIALGHPSAAGKSSGEGTSGSTGWNNAARSRLYLEYPGETKSGDVRQLTNKKLNYGPKGAGLKLRWVRGAFDVIAGSTPAALRDGNAIIPPSLGDAVESAVVSALIDYAGEKLPLSRAPNSSYNAPRLLKARYGDRLVAFGTAEVADALNRLEGRGAIRFDEVGRKNGRAVMSFVVVPDKLSDASAINGSVFG